MTVSIIAYILGLLTGTGIGIVVAGVMMMARENNRDAEIERMTEDAVRAGVQAAERSFAKMDRGQ